LVILSSYHDLRASITDDNGLINKKGSRGRKKQEKKKIQVTDTMRWLSVEDEVEGIFIIRDLRAKATEVEVVVDVVLVDLTEELIATQTAEPRDPRHILLFIPIYWPAYVRLLFISLWLCLYYDQFQNKTNFNG
jgi:hypothetical protein